MNFFLNQFVLVFYNVVNAKIDANRIKKHKRIYHGINGGLYLAFISLIIWIADYNLPNGVLFTFASFFQRQVVFDTALNRFRGLRWYYQSTANPPKSIIDRLERLLFPHNDGVKIFFFYLNMWLITIAIKLMIS